MNGHLSKLIFLLVLSGSFSCVESPSRRSEPVVSESQPLENSKSSQESHEAPRIAPRAEVEVSGTETEPFDSEPEASDSEPKAPDVETETTEPISQEGNSSPVNEHHEESENASPSEVPESGPALILPSSDQSLENLLERYPRVNKQREAGKRFLFGGLMSDPVPSATTSPEQIASDWIQNHSGVWGVEDLALELVETRELRGGRVSVLLFQQWMEGVPVEDALVRLHVRRFDNGSSQVSYVFSQLAPSVPLEPIQMSAEDVIDELRQQPIFSGLDSWASMGSVVFYDFQVSGESLARRAWKIDARNSDLGARQAFHLYIDSSTGELLRVKNLAFHLDASGQVSGFGVSGLGPFRSDSELSSFALEGVFVENVGNAASLTDMQGMYSMPFFGPGPDNIRATLAFPHDSTSSGVTVYPVVSEGPTVIGNPFRRSQVITSDSIVNFSFNESADFQTTLLETAGVNVYRASRSAYNFFQDRIPGGWAGLDAQNVFAIVGLSAVECNAVYLGDADPANPAFMLFYEEGANCYNSAYSTVVVHEYGHHVVARLGLDQEAFGEGFADALAMLVYDTPGVGFDLFKDESFLRNPPAANVLFPCGSSSIHFCGQVLAGLWYEIRKRVGLEVARQLFVDWSQVTSGGLQLGGIEQSATPTTIVEILQTDDDTNGDSNYENGTPHQEAICAAAQKYNLDCPVLLNFNFVSEPPSVTLPGQAVEIEVSVTGEQALATPQANSGVLFFRVNGGAWESLPMSFTAGPPHRYLGVLPALREGDRLEYYISAQTTGGSTALFGSATNSFVLISELPARTNIVRSLPRKWTQLIAPDVQGGGSADARLFLTGNEQNSNLTSFRATDLENNRLEITRLPAGVFLGSQSLIYPRRDAAIFNLIFTNDSRSRVYFASDTDTLISVNRSFCGEFQEISRIHLSEAGGGPERLLVADKGAGRLYSFALDPTDPSLCIDKRSISLPDVQFIVSPTTNAPSTIIVGYRENRRLYMRKFRSDNLASLSSVELMSENREAVFGKPLNALNDGVFIPIRFANHPERGADYIRFVSQDLNTQEDLQTCRSPDELRSDGGGHLLVLCRVARRVQVYSKQNRQKRREMEAGLSPQAMIAIESAPFFYVGIQQGNQSMLRYQLDVASAQVISSSSFPLSGRYDQMERLHSANSIVGLERQRALMSRIDLVQASVLSDFILPDQMDDVAAESGSSLHFISRSLGRWYSFGALDADNWILRSNSTGALPRQIAYADSRAYVLSEGANQFQIFNTVSAASLASVPTQMRPIGFDFARGAQNRAWIMNRDSQSLTTVNIADGAEGLVAHSPLGFRPRALAGAPNMTVVAGGQSIRVFNPSTGAFVRDEQTAFPVDRLARRGNSALGVSSLGATAYDFSVSPPSAFHVAAGAEFIAGGEHRVILGYPNQSFLQSLDSTNEILSQTSLNPFNLMVQSLDHIAIYDPVVRALRFFPHESSSAAANLGPSLLSLDSEILPKRAVADLSGHIWFVDHEKLELQVIGPGLQPERIQNKLINRLEELSSDGGDLLFVSARNNNAVYVYNLDTEQVYAHRVCDSPTRLQYDTVDDLLFVLCSRSNSVAVLNFATTGTGVLDAIHFIPTGQRPSDIALKEGEFLFVANRDDSSITVYDLQTPGRDQVADLSLDGPPHEIRYDDQVDKLYVTIPYSKQLPVIERVAGNFVFEDPSIMLPGPGFQKLRLNTATNRAYAIAGTPASFFAEGSGSFSSQNTLLTTVFPISLEISEAQNKVLVLYQGQEAVRIFDIAAETSVDLAVGRGASEMLVVEASNRAYVSNSFDHTVSVIDLTDDSLVTTLSGFGQDCGPRKMVERGGVLAVACQANDTLALVPLSGPHMHQVQQVILLRSQD